MATIIKTKDQIEKIREGGKILAKVMKEVGSFIKPGISTKDIDDYAFKLIKEYGGIPAFLNYRPEGASSPFPASVCISLNNEIVHGIPSSSRILKEGDIISVDIGLEYKNFFTDHAMTFPVGKISKKDQDLIDATKKSLELAIWSAVAGNTIGDIGHSIETFVNRKYGIVRELAGHGVGVHIHEDPYVPNYGKAGKGERLVPGMILAIEPMLNIGKDDIIVASDDWTIKTADGSRSAHFEHTILITENEAEIITII